MSEHTRNQKVTASRCPFAGSGIIRGVFITFLLMFLSQLLSAQNMPPSVLSTSPTKNALNVPENSNISATFNAALDASTPTSGTIKVKWNKNADKTGLESASSNKANATPFGVPTITTFSPTSGPVGTVVTITGTNFNGVPSNNIVFFGAVKAAVTISSATSLSVTVPAGATYAPITITDMTTGLTAYSSEPFIGTFPSSRIIDATSFAPKVDFETALTPDFPVMSDIDGDGMADLIVSNSNSSSVAVLRNTSMSGNIALAPRVDFEAGVNPCGVAIGDIDGNGKPDFAVANYGSNTISVLQNTSTSGSISFAAKADFAAGSVPFHVAMRDLDGDGKVDLVCSNAYSNTVSVFRNTSTGGSVSFAEKLDLATGTYPCALGICDIDGDGKPDIVVVNAFSNTVSVFQNTCTDGYISFTAGVVLTSGSRPCRVVIGDMDCDGKPDIAVTNSSSNTVSVFLNTSSIGSFSFAARNDFPTGSTPIGIAAGDLDGDGKPDLAIANLHSNSISIFHNASTTGNVSLEPRIDFATGTGPFHVVIGDVDGDGKPDVALTNTVDNTVSVLRNTTVPPNRPPDCANAAPSIAEIRPPNHRMVDVNILNVTDPDDDPVTITITKITQDEPVNTVGDGNFEPDGGGLGTSTAQVRAERAGTPKVPGNGRVYEISFTASDGRGGDCSGSVKVCIPHDQRRGHSCVDDGQKYNSVPGAIEGTIAGSGAAEESVETEIVALIPREHILGNAYPNPFNPSTTIRYEISERTRVVLRVLDLLGRPVATLVDEEKLPGEYQVKWDASGLATGFYLYRLQAGEFLQTKKLLLLR